MLADWIYQALAAIGYTHPIHPALVHIPIGNIIAALIFGIIGLIFKKNNIGRAGYFTLSLAFVSLFPGIFFAITDWLRYYGGAWLFAIKIKIILTAILSILLIIAIVTGWRDTKATRLGLFLSFLCFLTITGLGYFGANLVYSGTPKASARELETGRQIFAVNCQFCHPQGGNIIRSDLPLLGAPQLSDTAKFTSYIRNPTLPTGNKGTMPGFPKSKISDDQSKALYDYIVEVLQNQVIQRKTGSSTGPAKPKNTE